MEIRKFERRDAKEVSDLIIKTLRISNSRDYSEERIEDDVKMMQPEFILERAVWTHFYVAEDNGIIIGCGAIGPYWGKKDESCLFNIFVLPEYQHCGVGSKIIDTLENDDFFLRAKRIEIPSSITGVSFYIKKGYYYKNGIDRPDDEGLFRLEKFRQ